jgi:hypothetical protein
VLFAGADRAGRGDAAASASVRVRIGASRDGLSRGSAAAGRQRLDSASAGAEPIIARDPAMIRLYELAARSPARR